MMRAGVLSILLLLLIGSGEIASGAKVPCDELLQGKSTKLPKIEPVILRPLARLTDNPNYLYEMKYDGFRGVAYFEPERCRFRSRNGVTLTQFQSLCADIAKELKVQNAIFDGEVIAVDRTDRPIFDKLLRHQGPLRYVAFDLLWLNGEDLRPLPLAERRERLLKILPKSSRRIVEPIAQTGSGFRLFDLMVEHDLEGIVVKRLNDRYSPNTRWYKYKNREYSQAVGRHRFFN